MAEGSEPGPSAIPVCARTPFRPNVRTRTAAEPVTGPSPTSDLSLHEHPGQEFRRGLPPRISKRRPRECLFGSWLQVRECDRRASCGEPPVGEAISDVRFVPTPPVTLHDGFLRFLVRGD
jgi:hypothetical protein